MYRNTSPWQHGTVELGVPVLYLQVNKQWTNTHRAVMYWWIPYRCQSPTLIIAQPRAYILHGPLGDPSDATITTNSTHNCILITCVLTVLFSWFHVLTLVCSYFLLLHLTSCCFSSCNPYQCPQMWPCALHMKQYRPTVLISAWQTHKLVRLCKPYPKPFILGF